MTNLSRIVTDYHMHSTFSPDAHDPPAELCRRALELGFTAIAITEHAEWHPVRQQDGFPNADDYFAAIAQVQAEFEPLGLTVYSGIELGNPQDYPVQAAELVAAYPFDLVIGSLHWLYGENLQLEPCFAHRDPYQVYIDYFVELERMVTSFDFDMVAHFDRIFYRGVQLGAAFDAARLEPVVRPTLAAIARYDRALELNTRYLKHKFNWNEALVTMLRWFLEEGGSRVAVNSDAHRAAELGRNLELAEELLLMAGFKLPEQFLTLTSFNHNRPR
jgi:histidinol-phosphatase (PHP family)